MNSVGSAVFDNLPLIFAVGVAIGMAQKEKEVAALSAVIAFFVMNTAINAMLTITGQILDNGEIAENCSGRNDHFCLRYSVLADGCVWRYYRRTWELQPCITRFYRDTASECAVILWRNPICTDYFHDRVYVCRNPSLLCMAGCSEPEFTLWAVW